MPANQEALERLRQEEFDAWAEYLENTKLKFKKRYEEIEPWAWSRLQQRLRAITARRNRIAA